MPNSSTGMFSRVFGRKPNATGTLTSASTTTSASAPLASTTGAATGASSAAGGAMSSATGAGIEAGLGLAGTAIGLGTKVANAYKPENQSDNYRLQGEANGSLAGAATLGTLGAVFLGPQGAAIGAQLGDSLGGFIGGGIGSSMKNDEFIRKQREEADKAYIKSIKANTSATYFSGPRYAEGGTVQDKPRRPITQKPNKEEEAARNNFRSQSSNPQRKTGNLIFDLYNRPKPIVIGQRSESYPVDTDQLSGYGGYDSYYPIMPQDAARPASNYVARSGNRVVDKTTGQKYTLMNANAPETFLPLNLVSPYALDAREMLQNKLSGSKESYVIPMNNTAAHYRRTNQLIENGPKFALVDESGKNQAELFSNQLAQAGLSLGGQSRYTQSLTKEAMENRRGMFEQDTVIDPRAISNYAFNNQDIQVGKTLFKRQNNDLEKFTARQKERYNALRRAEQSFEDGGVIKAPMYPKGGIVLKGQAHSKIGMLGGGNPGYNINGEKVIEVESRELILDLATSKRIEALRESGKKSDIRAIGKIIKTSLEDYAK